ncbi:CTLH/CRA C-terminal to lish motif domain-containing protein [Glomus cerebriforme]|uniref:CTLH/CRA C-terminal to lish motif domain-containing protein n=1 Tax=Glomus cerebriforme TaxID=658196 RepID=A0A397SNR5_9GLOM|nr:CTLH/CRA C-terminal to lish motif domain-containing protein [Glomus cerebriforme]
MEPCPEAYQNNEEPDDTVVRQLVLDYLVHNCYGETAKVFFKDALNVGEPSIEHDLNGSIQNGSTNGTANGTIQNGNGSPVPMDIIVDEDGDCEMTDSIQEECMHIDSTSELICKETNSSKLLEVLKNKNSNGYGESFNAEFALKSLETRKKIRHFIIAGSINEALTLCRNKFPHVVSSDEQDLRTSARSIDICFRLQCQQFIETVRAGNPIEALLFAQSVLTSFPKKKGANEEKFNAELKVMSALMAYEDPENSPVGSLLAQEHRDKLADEINSAILSFDCHTSESALERIAKQATLVREYLHSVMSRGQRNSKLSTFIQEGS